MHYIQYYTIYTYISIKNKSYITARDKINLFGEVYTSHLLLRLFIFAFQTICLNIPFPVKDFSFSLFFLSEVALTAWHTANLDQGNLQGDWTSSVRPRCIITHFSAIIKQNGTYLSFQILFFLCIDITVFQQLLHVYS